MKTPKYKTGQEVWYFDEGQGCAIVDTVASYEEDLNMYFLKNNGNLHDPSDLFSSERRCMEAHV